MSRKYSSVAGDTSNAVEVVHQSQGFVGSDTVHKWKYGAGSLKDLENSHLAQVPSGRLTYGSVTDPNQQREP